MRGLLILIAAVVIFTVFSTVFAITDEKPRVRLFPKWVWVLLCLFTTPIGGILYLIYGRGPKPEAWQ